MASPLDSTCSCMAHADSRGKLIDAGDTEEANTLISPISPTTLESMDLEPETENRSQPLKQILSLKATHVDEKNLQAELNEQRVASDNKKAQMEDKIQALADTLSKLRKEFADASEKKDKVIRKFTSQQTEFDKATKKIQQQRETLTMQQTELTKDQQRLHHQRQMFEKEKSEWESRRDAREVQLLKDAKKLAKFKLTRDKSNIAFTALKKDLQARAERIEVLEDALKQAGQKHRYMGAYLDQEVEKARRETEESLRPRITQEVEQQLREEFSKDDGLETARESAKLRRKNEEWQRRFDRFQKETWAACQAQMAVFCASTFPLQEENADIADRIRLRNLVDQVQARLTLEADLERIGDEIPSLAWRRHLEDIKDTQLRIDYARELLQDRMSLSEDWIANLVQNDRAMEIICENRSTLRKAGNNIHDLFSRAEYEQSIKNCRRYDKRGDQETMEALIDFVFAPKTDLGE